MKHIYERQITCRLTLNANVASYLMDEMKENRYCAFSSGDDETNIENHINAKDKIILTDWIEQLSYILNLIDRCKTTAEGTNHSD